MFKTIRTRHKSTKNLFRNVKFDFHPFRTKMQLQKDAFKYSFCKNNIKDNKKTRHEFKFSFGNLALFFSFGNVENQQTCQHSEFATFTIYLTTISRLFHSF
jgi:hypothetical protein